MTPAPYRPGAELDAQSFNEVRRSMVLEHCKWDPQVADKATLANFPLVMSKATWHRLSSWAEALAAEASAAESELQSRPELHARLGIPWRLRRALRAKRAAETCRLPRALRFDFHFTRDGWRISECNADVPGGYAEASAFSALMTRHYRSLATAGDPGGAWAGAVAQAAEGGDVALLSAPGFPRHGDMEPKPSHERDARPSYSATGGCGDRSTRIRITKALPSSIIVGDSWLIRRSSSGDSKAR